MGYDKKGKGGSFWRPHHAKKAPRRYPGTPQTLTYGEYFNDKTYQKENGTVSGGPVDQAGS